MVQLVQQAFRELYPDKEMPGMELKYSRAFNGYNANVKYSRTLMRFNLSYAWKDVSEDIKIGLLQSLLNKIYKTSIKTINIELYEIFLKKVPSFTKKTESEPVLEESFKRMNEAYFAGMMLQPNLRFGGENFRTLGTYNYNEDTIMISQILMKDQNLMDYVMYHEMLHKKLRSEKRGKRTIHHSRHFRELERQYHDKDAEKKLQAFVRRERFRMSWF
jgi:hypothetical protein